MRSFFFEDRELERDESEDDDALFRRRRERDFDFKGDDEEEEEDRDELDEDRDDEEEDEEDRDELDEDLEEADDDDDDEEEREVFLPVLDEEDLEDFFECFFFTGEVKAVARGVGFTLAEEDFNEKEMVDVRLLAVPWPNSSLVTADEKEEEVVGAVSKTLTKDGPNVGNRLAVVSVVAVGVGVLDAGNTASD